MPQLPQVSKSQKAFHLELDRCTGCSACQIACQIENGLAAGTSWRRVLTYNEWHVPGVAQFHLSLACNHCLDAPCEKNCPALAYDKDPGTGAVTIDPERCIGCKYCSWACPYDAPQFDAPAGVMTKCTFCSHRLAQDLEPACTTSCPTGALGFGDYVPALGGEPPPPAPVPGLYRENIEPAISIRPSAPTPASASAHEPISGVGRVGRVDWLSGAEAEAPKVTLRSEWSLLVFTVVAPMLVALVASAKIPPPLVALVGLAAMGLSAAHLGKPARAYRAVLNWRRSWLSREVLLFPAFVALSLIPGGSARSVATAVGFMALFAMDQVYRLPTNPKRRELGSASVLLTGLYLGAVLLELWPVLVPLAALKLVLYLERRFPFRFEGGLFRQLLFAARLLLGFAVPMFLVRFGYPLVLAFASVVAGEVLDRVEFYLDLDFVRPAAEMRRDLERRLAARR